MNIGKTAATLTMKGAGYYSRSTCGAKDVIDNAVNMLIEATAAIAAPPVGFPPHIADFGAADGGTSKKSIRETIAALRQRFPDRQIEVTYSDLPSNDYSNLFKNMLGLITEAKFTDASFSQYYRTKEEFCAPFVDKTSAVCQAGLRLISVFTGLINAPVGRLMKPLTGPCVTANSPVPTSRLCAHGAKRCF